MTNNQEQATNYLLHIRNISKNLNNMRLELEALQYRAGGAGGIRYDKDHVQTSPDDYLAIAIGDIIALEKQIAKEESVIEKRKGKAYSIVRQMDKAEHRTIIEWYYFNGLSMIDTAEKMNVAERTAYYLRDDALEAFGDLLTKK
jgi:DNA-directed RNA polymerase specialized sigma subunit